MGIAQKLTISSFHGIARVRRIHECAVSTRSFWGKITVLVLELPDRLADGYFCFLRESVS